MIVQVITSDGVVGLGEALPPFMEMEIEAGKLLIDSAKSLLIGEDASNVEPIAKKLYAAYGLNHFHSHASNWAWNAIETALWDIVGKESGKPLYKIWGGAFRKKIPYFGIIMRDPGLTTEKVAELSVELVSRGFKTLFMKVGFSGKSMHPSLKSNRPPIITSSTRLS